MKIFSALALATILPAAMFSVVGCVEVPVVERWPRTSTTGVRKIGPDTYYVEIVRRSESPSDATLAAHHYARRTCEKQNKIELITQESHSVDYNIIELTFECLDYDDQEIQKIYSHKKQESLK